MASSAKAGDGTRALPVPFLRTDAAPASALEVLGWTTPSELTFVHDFLRDHYTGEGAAVELGCAFGRSTVAMLVGLTANRRAAPRNLHVFDLLQLDWFLHRELERAGEAGDLREGDGFEPVFWRQVAPWRKRVELHRGDITKAGWDGGAIEFLFVDIMKSWDTAAAVIRTFYPSLSTGAVLVHQDFKHPFAPQVLLTHHRLRRYFEPAWDIAGDGSASVAFRVVRTIPAVEIEAALAAGLCDLASYSIGEIEAAFDAATAMVVASPEAERSRLQAARLVLFGELIASRSDFLHGAGQVGMPIRDWFLGQMGMLGLSADTAAQRERHELASERDLLRSTLQQIERSRCGRLVFAWWGWRKRWRRARPTPPELRTP